MNSFTSTIRVLSNQVAVQCGEQMRTISQCVMVGQVEVPFETAALVSEWGMVEHECPDPNDVISFNLRAMARCRCPSFRRITDSVFEFLRSRGVDAARADCGYTGMVCTGVGFHHDLSLNASKVFCVIWLSDEAPMDLVFPHIGERIRLEMGTVVLFDSGQPHAVLRPGESVFVPADYRDEPLHYCMSIDLDATCPTVADVMGIRVANTIAGAVPLSRPGLGTVESETGAWSVPTK